MKVLVVYVGQGSVENFDHGLRNGVWGFKAAKRPTKTIEPGDYILFGRGFTGGSPRLPAEEWSKHQIGELAWGRITTGLQKETAPEWPDEKRKSQVVYPYRLHFEDVQRSSRPTPLSGDQKLPARLAEALRLSAIANSGYIEEVQSWPVDKTATTPKPPQPPKPKSPAKRSVDDTLIEIENFIASRGFVFSRRVLRAFYASLRSKPFVILAGNSGTGKSRLVRLFAEASGATVDNGRFTMIAVRPDWNDSSELLGFFDLNGDFIPGQLMAPILMAHCEPTNPFFVCLDEMNLARVEHYFSDFLSIAESRRRHSGQIITDPILRESHLQKMKTDSLRSEAREALTRLRSPARPLGVPENLFIFGTVNMDETTQPFSRKVLDRAHTLEFNDIDLLQGVEEEAAAAEVPALALDQSFFAPGISCLTDALPEHRDKAREIAEFITGLNADLSQAGFEVGYRVRDEAISFAVYAEQAGLSGNEVREAVVLQKILPRIQGSSPRVEKVLIALLNKLKGDTTVPQADDPGFDEQLSALRNDPNSSAVLQKIAGMLRIFRDENFTSFWLA
jgi:energy-coupling factor transporter ATP-binding protein EcfA2